MVQLPWGGGFSMENKKIPNRSLAIYALISGVCSLTLLWDPPKQMLFGAIAVILAYASKSGKKLSDISMAATVLGIVSIVCSIVIFAAIVIFFSLMRDPANAPAFRELFDLLEQFINSPNNLSMAK